MKKAKDAKNNSTPYRSLGLNMVKAPVKTENEPKCVRTDAKEDLRAKGGK